MVIVCGCNVLSRSDLLNWLNLKCPPAENQYSVENRIVALVGEYLGGSWSQYYVNQEGSPTPSMNDNDPAAYLSNLGDIKTFPLSRVSNLAITKKDDIESSVDDVTKLDRKQLPLLVACLPLNSDIETWLSTMVNRVLENGFMMTAFCEVPKISTAGLSDTDSYISSTFDRLCAALQVGWPIKLSDRATRFNSEALPLSAQETSGWFKMGGLGPICLEIELVPGEGRTWTTETSLSLAVVEKICQKFQPIPPPIIFSTPRGMDKVDAELFLKWLDDKEAIVTNRNSIFFSNPFGLLTNPPVYFFEGIRHLIDNDINVIVSLSPDRAMMTRTAKIENPFPTNTCLIGEDDLELFLEYCMTTKAPKLVWTSSGNFFKSDLKKFGGFGARLKFNMISERLLRDKRERLLDALDWSWEPVAKPKQIKMQFKCDVCDKLFDCEDNEPYRKFSMVYCSTKCLSIHRQNGFKKLTTELN